MSMSGLLFPPSHWRAFSVCGRAEMRSKFLQEDMRFELSVAGSSMMIVIRDKKRI